MIVYLYRVGRNLNRAYRTCEAFGVTDLRLVECSAVLEGNLYKAKGRVEVATVESLPLAPRTLALETWGKQSILDVQWDRFDQVVLGGETHGLPRKAAFEVVAKIPTFGMVSGLTVEATLAIVLHEWRRWQNANPKF